MLGPFSAILLSFATAGALPPPPQKVVFPTRRGDVTLDHAAHLARRTPCKACHGPGRVGKLEDFEMQRAHLMCVGCHRDGNAGPTLCSGCHSPAAQPDGQGEREAEPHPDGAAGGGPVEAGPAEEASG